MLGKPRILFFFSPTRLINSIKHEHSCKILYVLPQDCLHFQFQTMDIIHQISNNGYYSSNFKQCSPGRVAQSVTCLTPDASLTADPGVASLIPARSHT